MATKLVPKGFVINSSSVASVKTPNQSQTGCTLVIQGQAWDTGTFSPSPLISTTSYTSNNTVTLNAGPTITGDGSNVVCLYFLSNALSGQLVHGTNAVSGARITLFRN